MAKPTADRYAERRPRQPMVRRATSWKVYTAQVTIATKIFGSATDIACTRGSSGAVASASVTHTAPLSRPTVISTQPMNTVREFMTSSTCNEGSRVKKNTRCLALISLNCNT
jgi:hypothetical protein